MSIKITSEEAAKNFDDICKRLVETGELVRISRPDGENVVLISETELESLLETLYLLRSPANSTRLFTALERARAKSIEPQLVSELYERFGLNENDSNSDIATAS
ncbi:type II toxin-antitoxin system Phd/YefM family antitoxin [Nostoc sp. UHCC 0702]|nr:type II toxin-antitoxin system Phd/YefM family antitoxin [Nostoc sp. UHCC 0702]